MGVKRIDLTGNVYNRLTVLKYIKSTPHTSYWLCRCECGNEKIISASSFKNGTTKSCGCMANEKEDLTGHKYGRLLVTGISHKGIHNEYYWICICDCGNTAIICKGSLKSGNTMSCGCYNKEKTTLRNMVHGDAKRGIKPTEYTAWSSMITRCTNPKNKAYKHYGERGITVCERWLHSYENFLEDMGRKPSAQHTLERNNVDGNYEKSNCRWATMKEQSRNKTNTLSIDVDGKKYNLKALAESNGIKYHTLRWRFKNGRELGLTTTATIIL